jgi:hypothetical protein
VLQILDDPRDDHRVSGWCPACRLAWSSKAEAHCAHCCRHFSSEQAFDAHQRLSKLGQVVCRDPARTRGRLVAEDGRWRLADDTAPPKPSPPGPTRRRVGATRSRRRPGLAQQ